MKNLLIYLGLACILLTCTDRTPEPAIVPDWLVPRLVELQQSEACTGCYVQRSEYKDQVYYHVYCPTWSCVYCEVYRDSLVPIDWAKEDPDFGEWLNNRTHIQKIWECGDALP